jgi:hypothetical protein
MDSDSVGMSRGFSAHRTIAALPKEFKEAYDQASPEIQQMISDKIRASKAKSEVSDFPLNLPVPALGQLSHI